MKKNQLPTKSIVALSLSAMFMSEAALAAGFYLNEHSANGLGRAFAGQAVVAENATVLYSNPAAITQFDKATSSLFISYVDPGIDSEGTVTLTNQGQTLTLDANQEGVAGSAIIPAAFYARPINDQWSVGLGMYSNYGLASDYDDSFNGLHFGDRAEIKSININPTVAYKLSDTLSLGLGLNAVYSEAELSTSVPAVISGAVGGVVPPLARIAKVEGDDWSFGWNLGVHWSPTDATQVGLSYRAEVDLNLSGEMRSDVVAPYNQPGSVDIELPAVAELSVNHAFTEQLSVQASINWFGWSSFDVLEANLENGIDVLLKEEKFHNTKKYSVGTTYVFDTEWTLRAGVAYDEGAVSDEHRSISIPDTDRRWFSVGATYTLDESITIDAGFVKVLGKEAAVNEQTAFGPLTSTLQATQNASATILSAQLNYTF
ncbi:outer membrane protein transport protein [Psychrosphaera ytuae]|uniref:Outer membrane protein transport protein n=1 Tax=Psychrosphaera ytuae TaxID=2820710 RepID=A0A975DCP3_9GAMM|nr:outer membrane protein transport protein [Psychrosphaera ytuae]QTH63926.1 outer membrane protein transport protein [Psychrosphaera ytuae]